MCLSECSLLWISFARKCTIIVFFTSYSPVQFHSMWNVCIERKLWLILNPKPVAHILTSSSHFIVKSQQERNRKIYMTPRRAYILLNFTFYDWLFFIYRFHGFYDATSISCRDREFEEDYRLPCQTLILYHWSCVFDSSLSLSTKIENLEITTTVVSRMMGA